MAITLIDLYQSDDTRAKIAAAVLNPAGTQPILWALRRVSAHDSYLSGAMFNPAIFPHTSGFSELYDVAITPDQLFGTSSGGVYTPYSGTVWLVHGDSGLSAAVNAPTVSSTNNHIAKECVNRFGAIPPNTDASDSQVAAVVLSFLRVGGFPTDYTPSMLQ